MGYEGAQDTPPQNMPLGDIVYLEVKALEKQQRQEKPSALPRPPKSRAQISLFTKKKKKKFHL